MKKKLLALAVAGALAAPVAAMADTGNVTIYGQANVSFDAVTSGLTAGSASTNHVSSNASRIGFKGSEDLGGGTSAIWQIESLVNLDGTAGTAANAGNLLGGRNTFAGLSGESWGTLLLGRHDTPYKLATRGLDLFADTIADNRSIMGLAIGDLRLTDVAAYISPAMSGLTVAIATVAGAEAATSGQTKGGAWSLAGMYNAGPINASLSYQVIDNGSGANGTMGSILGAQASPDNRTKAWKLGGGYTMDALQLNAIYEKTSSSGVNAAALSNAFDRRAWYLAGKYNVSASDAVKLAYTSAGDVGNGAGGTTANSSASQFSLGYDHGMSKRTTVYALYTKISNKAAAIYNLGGSGIATSGTVIALDADPSAFSVGMKHTF